MKNVENNIQKITTYSVTFHTSDSSDLIYLGLDIDEAFYIFETFDDIPGRMFNRTDMFVEIAVQTNEYVFVYELDSDFETIDDYPIEEFYDDPFVYELINEGEWVSIELRKIEPKNKKSDELLNDVSSYFQKKYRNYKYNIINVYDEGEEYKGCIQLRISDHTENINNIDRHASCDCYISVVICDFDATRKRFGMTNAFERRRNEFELTFSSKDNFAGVIEEIENQIEECKEMILDK